MVVRKKKTFSSLDTAISIHGSSRVYMLLDITDLPDQAVAAIRNSYEAFAGMPQSSRKSPSIARLRPNLDFEDEDLEEEEEDEEDEEEEEEEAEEEESEDEEWEEEPDGVDKSRADDYLVKQLEVENKERLLKGNFPKTGWNEAAIREVLKRLSKRRLLKKKKIFLKAIENGGQISRAQVYEVANYPLDRSLKGFGRPVRTMMSSLKEQGLLSEKSAPFMDNIYDNTIKSYKRVQGFKVPLEIVVLMRKIGLMTDAPAGEKAAP